MDKVLIVDGYNDPDRTIARALMPKYETITITSGFEAESVLCGEIISAIVVHQHIYNDDSLEFLGRVNSSYPAVPKILMSDLEDEQNLRAAIGDGAIFSFISKPWNASQLLLTIDKAVECHNLKNTNRILSHELNQCRVTHIERVAFQKHQNEHRLHEDGFISAENSPMQNVLFELGKIAKFDVSLLITGESGTGKELLARAIHTNSRRADKPFVIENCGAMHEDLLCSELFGHRRGAFTGATSDHVGLFEKADGGTIFLDEIGETSSGFQVKLLRVLQEGEIRPLGANVTKKVNVRVVAATNRNLLDEMEFRRFRPDLYYRLATMHIDILPLRRRKMDIAPISERILSNIAPGFGKENARLSDETLRVMHHYDWPGNVRELENEIKRMLVLGLGTLLTPDLLSEHIYKLRNSEFSVEVVTELKDGQCILKDHVENLEKKLISQILGQQRWNKSQAANILGLSRVGLANKIERYDISRERESQP